MRILITGATGLIGRPLLEALDEAGHELAVLILPGTEAELPAARADVFVGSVTEPQAIRRAARGAEVIVHAAGALPSSSPRILAHVNVEGTGRVMEVVARLPEARRVVWVGSTAVYAPAPRRAWPIDERYPIVSDWGSMTYGRSKALAESIVRSTASDAQLECVVLRPSVVYGTDAAFLAPLMRAVARGPAALLPAALRQWPMQWVHVDDMTEALLAAVTRPHLDEATCHIAGGELFGAHDLRRLALRLATGASPSGQLPPRVLKFDLGQASRLLGFHPVVSLSDGLAETFGALER